VTPSKAPYVSLRRCIVTQKACAKADLIRFVLRPQGSDIVVEPDLTGASPGRGLWVTARRDIVQAAVDRGAFQRAARRRVVVRSDLAATVAEDLAQHCRAQSERIARAGSTQVGPAARRMARDEARLAGLGVDSNTGTEARNGR
jgi:uncharacterized protein